MKKVKVLICGGRYFSDVKVMNSLFNSILRKYKEFRLVTGGAPGADELALHTAIRRGIVTEVYPANWDKYGQAAGPIRNKQMLDEGQPDVVVALPGGRGTANMIKQAEEQGIEVKKVELC